MQNSEDSQAVSAFERSDGAFPSAESGGGLSITEIIRTVRTRTIPVVLAFVVVFGLSVLYCMFATPKYEGVTRVDIDPNRSSTTSLSDTLAQTLGDTEASTRVQTEMQVMQSDTVLLHVAQKLDLPHRAPFTKIKSIKRNPLPKGSFQLSAEQQDDLLAAMRDALKISVTPGTTLVEVHFKDASPTLASEVPNMIVDFYIEQDLGASSAGEARVAAWLGSEMRDLREQAAEAQTKLAEFQRANNVIGIDESQNILVDKLRLLNQQLTDAEADRIVKMSLYEVAKTHDPKLLANLSQGATLQVLRAQQVELQSQYNQVGAKYGAGYPKLQEWKYQLDKINSDIRTESSNLEKRFEEEYLSSKKSENDLRANFDKEAQSFYKLNEGAAHFAMLRHDATSTRDLYDALQYKLKEAGISETLKSTMIRIIDNARQPGIPVQPKVPLVLSLGFFLGIFGGIGLALVLDSVDDSIRTSNDVEEFTGLPVLTSVPRFSIPGGKKGAAAAAADASVEFPKLPVLSQQFSVGAESYRQLRTSILLSLLDAPPRVILFGSAHASEGKSITSANYATVMALGGASVLLIDADLRRGTIHEYFKIRKEPGLTDALSGSLKIEDFPRPLAAYPGLAVLPTGVTAPNPSEVLSSHRMVEFLEQCRKKFDFVIIDSAPLLLVSDSHALAARADAVLLVVRAGVTRKRAIARVKEVLRREKSPLIGAVLNDVNLKIENYYTYGGSYGYHKYESK